jgi:hypothetical protein
MRRVGTLVVGAVFGIALVVSCGVANRPGNMLDDMGNLVGDLFGLDLGSVKDAAAAPPMSANCDKVWSTNPGQPSRSDYHFAEFSVPGYDPTQPDHLTATVCNPSAMGVVALLETCPSGTVCDPIPSPGGCEVAAIPSIGPGVVRVDCGFTSYSSGNVSAMLKWDKAYLKVGP